MATEAISEGRLKEAVDHLTKAILLNPTSALMYATRASVFIKLKKLAAAICDANAALEINPDSAKGYKTRGMANAMLGKWEEAARDLHVASNIDYDDEISATLKKVEPNAHKIAEHRRKYERLWKERNDKKAKRDRLRRRAEAQAAYKKAKRSEQSSNGGIPGGFPGGGMPGGFHADFLGTAKRLLCSTTSADYLSEVLDNGNMRFNETSLNFIPFPDTEPNSIPIPTERFAVPKSSSPYDFWSFLGCRHGLAILLNEILHEVVVWDPLTGQQHRVSFPQELPDKSFDEEEEFILWEWHTAVLCADTEEGHVHGDCFSSPFKLVLICSGMADAFFSTVPTYACLYDSASGVWGDVVSTDARGLILTKRSSILTGNAFYWLFQGGDILVFDIERQSLGVIKKPACIHLPNNLSMQLLRTDNDSGLGLAVVSKSSIQLWERKSNYDGVVEWVLLLKNFQLERLYQKGMRTALQEEYLVGYEAYLVGYDEDSNALVLSMDFGEFMLELDSMQFRTISITSRCLGTIIQYPYRNFFTAGKGVGWRQAVLDL